MSRLYYKFDSNLKESNREFLTPYPDYIAFDNKEKRLHISVSCHDHSWCVDKNQLLSGRFKDLEVAITDYDDKEIHNYESMTDEDFKLLKSSEPYEVGMVFQEPSEYDEKFNAMLKNGNVSIHYNEEEIEFNCEHIDVIDYGD